MMINAWFASGETSDANFVDLNVHLWQWGALLGLIVALLLLDLLVFHREAHQITTKEAAIESAAWISVGVAFSLVTSSAVGLAVVLAGVAVAGRRAPPHPVVPAHPISKEVPS